MAKRTDIKKILIIGSGPIVIGQAAEFDYAGTQACLALKEEGYEVILANSNPATIMTDHSSADHIYIEPLTLETLRRIILKEKPDSLLSTLGGQSGLTLSMQLAKEGFLEQHGVKLLGAKGKVLYKDFGELLFTHFGLSGPLVLSASTYIEDITKHRYICEFDLKPALDEKTLYDRLTRDFAALGGHSAQGALEKLLPNSMRPVAVKKWGVDPATRAAQITREQKMALVHLCKHWQVPIDARGDLAHAVITSGGVSVREVDPKTMQSKKAQGLYFAGEVLDVDAYTGGYNLQIAWATGALAGQSAGEEEIEAI